MLYINIHIINVLTLEMGLEW